MENASLDGRPFRVNPSSVEWAYSVKTAQIDTIGGQVIQVLGTNIGDMAVLGQFGVGGWEEQEAFLVQAKSLAARNSSIRFLFPSRGWDFLVALRDFNQPGTPNSVEHSNTTVSPPWQLTLTIVQDNVGLTKIAQDDFISRLARGLGWKQTEYNGPLSLTMENYDAAQAAIQAQIANQNANAERVRVAAGRNG